MNLKVRFNRKNFVFITRFIAALLVPVLAYLGIQLTDITSWAALGQILIDFISNPYLVVLTVFNGLNTWPDPTTTGLGDSPAALTYNAPREAAK